MSQHDRIVRLDRNRVMIVKTSSGTPVIEITIQGNRTVVVKQINWRVPVILGG